MNRLFQLIVLVFVGMQLAFAGPGDKPDRNDPPSKKRMVPAAQMFSEQAMSALNEQLSGLNLSGSGAYFAPSALFLADQPLSNATVSMRDSANALFNKLEREGKYLNGDTETEASLSPLQMPIGIKKHFGQNNTVYVAFSRAVIKPTHAELTAFVKMEMMVEDGQTGTRKKRELFFGADGIKMTNNGKIVGDARLVLLGDYTIPMFNGKMKLVLKGGEFNEATGGIVNGDKTFAILDCNGFREAGIMADAIFDPNVMKPIDPITGADKSGNVEATLRVIGGVTNFNDILGTLNFKSGFYVKDHKKWGFVVQNMFFDASLERNHSGIGYLNEYYTQHPDIAEGGDLNEWRGVGLNTFRLFLPPEFKKSSTGAGRVSIAVNNLIVDRYGVSCDIGVENIADYTLSDGKTNTDNAWRMSLDNFYLTFDQSRLAGGQFSGKLLLPVSKGNNAATMAANAFGYSAVIDLNSRYSLKVNSLKEIDFSIFGAKGQLSTQSYVELAVEQNNFVPKASLSGVMYLRPDKIKTSSGTEVSGSKNDQQLVFQELVLTTKKNSYISLVSAGYSRQSTLANFPVTVDNFNISISTTNEITRVSLQGGMNMNLMGGGDENKEATGFSCKSIFKITGQLNSVDGGIHQWDLVDMTIKPAGLNAKLSKFWFKGELEPFSNSNGDRGMKSELEFLKKDAGGAWVTLGLFNGLFGNNPEDNFRFWLVEGFANVKFMTIGMVDFKGIGGSVYHHLFPSNKPGQQPLFTSKNEKLNPDKPVSYVKSDHKLGFKAVMGMVTPGKDVMKGMVGFEMVFNSSWGVSSIGVFGNATIAADFGPGFNTPGFVKNLKDKFEDISTRATESGVGEVLSKSKLLVKGDSEYNKNNEKPGVGNAGTVAVGIALKLDLENNNFHGEGSVYVNAGILKGIHNGGLAGKFVMHFDKEEWYIHAGRPDERMGLRLDLGPIRVKSTSYLMVGHRIPPMPPPPPQIRALIGNGASTVSSRDETAIATGQGFAFGTDISLDTGPMRAAIFYAQFQAGAGFDMMLSKGNHSCEGIGGWYGRGQAYAYVSGDVGLTVKIGFIRKNISIFNAAAGVLLQSGLPNPAWFKGNVAGRYSALGGLVKGNFNIGLSIGNDNCTTASQSPNAALREENLVSFDNPIPAGARLMAVSSEVNPLIASYTPAKVESVTITDTLVSETLVNVPTTRTISVKNSVFTVPTIIFNYPVEKDFYLPGTSGIDTYRVKLNWARLLKGTATVASAAVWNEDKTGVWITPNAVLDANSDYKVEVSVQLFKNNVAQTGGRNVSDALIINFKTGEVDRKISAANIKHMYPVDGQRFLLRNEAPNGYIRLARTHSALTTLIANTRKVHFVSEVNAYSGTWTMAADSIAFAIPTGLALNTKYKFYLTGKFNGANGIDSVTVYEGEFRTSRYNTIAEKWNSISNPTTSIYKSAQKALTKNSLLLYANANMGEWFDEVDLEGNSLTGFQPLISAKNKLTESYYKGSVEPLLYSSAFTSAGLSQPSDREKAVLVSSKYLNYAKNLNELDSLKKWMPYQYSLTDQVHQDYEKLRNFVAANYVTENGWGSARNTEYRTKGALLLSGPVPYLENGVYSVDLYKRTPARSSNLTRTFQYNASGISDTRGYGTVTNIPGDALFVSRTFFNETILSICASPLVRLITTSKILQGAIIRMKATTEIILEEGFETFEDVDFEAETGACTNP